MRIAVMAGTPMDTKLGVDLINKNGFTQTISVPISKNPVEQTTFQSLEEEEREKYIRGVIDGMKNDIDAVFVYCNSLSSVVNFDKLEEEYKLPMITPMQMYRTLGVEYDYLAVMAANSHGLTGVENNLYIANPNLKVFGVTMLELVKAIETGKTQEEIIKQFDFQSLFHYFESTEIEAVVLGCTHFPYVKSELQQLSNIPIIDVSVYMIDRLKCYNKEGYSCFQSKK